MKAKTYRMIKHKVAAFTKGLFRRGIIASHYDAEVLYEFAALSSMSLHMTNSRIAARSDAKLAT